MGCRTLVSRRRPLVGHEATDDGTGSDRVPGRPIGQSEIHGHAAKFGTTISEPAAFRLVIQGVTNMFGTIARYRCRPGQVDGLIDEFKRFESSAPEGWLYHTIYRSTADPDEIWISVVFESEDLYRANADSPEMDATYRKLRERLVADPDWHDGSVLHQAMRTREPA